MSLVTIGLSAATMLVMAIVLSYILGWANKAFHVEVDPKVEAINEALPAANCGGCGYVGCGEYAEAVAAGEVPVNKCTVGGESCAAELAEIMGVEVTESYPYRPVVHCGARLDDRLQRSQYIGEQRCAPANLVTGIQGCTYGCLGFGDCYRACNFDAIEMSHEHELSKYERNGNRVDLDMLLDMGKKYQADIGWRPTNPAKNSGVPIKAESDGENRGRSPARRGSPSPQPSPAKGEGD